MLTKAQSRGRDTASLKHHEYILLKKQVYYNTFGKNKEVIAKILDLLLLQK